MERDSPPKKEKNNTIEVNGYQQLFGYESMIWIQNMSP